MTPDTSIYEYARQGLEVSRDRPALWFYGKSMTYGQLFSRIDHVADHLAALGVERGTVVTVHLPNCPQAVMAVYAVAKLGGICNMVHPQVPLEGLRENMAFTESKFLITGDHFSLCGEVDFAGKLIFVSLAAHMGAAYGLAYRLKNGVKRPERAVPFEKLERPAPVPARVPEQSSLAEECAVYLHSSGTTGTPKTVMHCHRALNQETLNAKRGFGLDQVNDVVLLEVLPIFHGTGLVIDIHIAISGGAKVVQMAAWSGKLAAKLIADQHVTMMTAVPRVYYALLEQKNFNGKNFRRFFAGGDVVDVELKEQFHRKTGKDIYEAYGMTELVASCCGETHDGSGRAGLTPFPDCRFAVLTQGDVPSLKGKGEIIVNSNTMMMGYFKNESSTADAFLVWNDKKWLRTGDYGVIDDFGNIHFKERLKNVIVHKGYNVFPAEVEAVIFRSGRVKEVCVVGIWDQKCHTQNVCACIVPKNEVVSGNIEKEIGDFCAKNLPAYAIPKSFRLFTDLPKNMLRKVQRGTLDI